MDCEECEIQASKYYCTECDQALCSECDVQIHKGGKRKQHIRPTICNQCRNQSNNYCMTCKLPICANCKPTHSQHVLESQESKQSCGIFWDLHSCRPEKPEEIEAIVSHFQEACGAVEFIKAYGDMFHKWENVLSINGIELLQNKGLKVTEQIVLDLSFSATKKAQKMVVITAKGKQMRAQFMQLQSNIPGLIIQVSSAIQPLVPVDAADILPESIQKKRQVGIRKSFGDIKFQFQANEQIKFNFGQDLQVGVVEYLRELSKEGCIIQEMQHFVKNCILRFKATENQIINAINSAIEQGSMIKQNKSFCGMIHMIFLGLKIDRLTLEVLHWILRSLRNDEMLPSERAILSRVKEAFDIKPSEEEWESLLQQAQQRRKDSRVTSYSAPVYSSTNRYSESEIQSGFPFLIISEIIDPALNKVTRLIYPENQQWEPLDQCIKEGDHLNIRSSDLWQEFIRFMEQHFNPIQNTKIKLETDQRAISGGRYGCAQFIKMCGPWKLRECSLGMLSYIVQQAINNDYLRYQKTMLIWTSIYIKHQIDVKTSQELNSIKNILIRLVTESVNGVSMSQLPIKLRQQLGYKPDLMQLGFAKLKDLLLTIPEIQIQIRGSNHPFAILNDPYERRYELDDIVDGIKEILKQNRFGVTAKRLEKLLNQNLHKKIDWNEYQSYSIISFIRKYANSVIEIIQTKDNTLIRLEDFSMVFRPNLIITETQQENSVQKYKNPNNYTQHRSQHSGSIFYRVSPSQRVLKISDLPEEIQKQQFTFPENNEQDKFSLFSTDDVSKEKQANSHVKSQSQNWYEHIKEFKFNDHHSWTRINGNIPPPGFN